MDDVDLFSGLLSEESEPGQLVGRTLSCLIGNQFHALKYGDRFYFETERMPEGFTDGKNSSWCVCVCVCVCVYVYV